MTVEEAKLALDEAMKEYAIARDAARAASRTEADKLGKLNAAQKDFDIATEDVRKKGAVVWNSKWHQDRNPGKAIA